MNACTNDDENDDGDEEEDDAGGGDDDDDDEDDYDDNSDGAHLVLRCARALHGESDEADVQAEDVARGHVGLGGDDALHVLVEDGEHVFLRNEKKNVERETTTTATREEHMYVRLNVRLRVCVPVCMVV